MGDLGSLNVTGIVSVLAVTALAAWLLADTYRARVHVKRQRRPSEHPASEQLTGNQGAGDGRAIDLHGSSSIAVAPESKIAHRGSENGTTATKRRDSGSDQGHVADHQARRMLWWTVGALTLGAVVQTGPIRAVIDQAYLGWSKALMHLFGALAAGCLLQLLRLLLGLCPRRRRWLNNAMAITTVLVVMPLLLQPPRTPHLFEPTWAAVAHWVASLALLSWSLGATSTACFGIAARAEARAAGVGMRLVASGCLIGLGYVATCLALLAYALITGSTPPLAHGTGLDVTLQQLAEVVIVIGLVWTSFDRLLHRFLGRERRRAGRAERKRWLVEHIHLVVGRRRQERHFHRLLLELEDIRPWWSALAESMPQLVHFPQQTAAAPANATDAGFQRRRMMSEIHDIERIAVAYVDHDDHEQIRSLALAHGLRAGAQLDIVVWQACVLLGLERYRARAPRSPLPLEVPAPRGASLAEATTMLSHALHGVHPLRERLLQVLHDNAMITSRR
ncbi:DUF6545 domain-containing protein [Kineococcus radiotolerans]|uniref:DUF6545 domain-containing protein n=1 Tax=Kineococcus radiotolerans (strain ATCC BAA-149 / DSM 14245 / SRS30216) TaxID=266940 RepID=A6WGX9_KINRD|nr:DUF6545 domain-containing protein [Kineococcus radiotolerans]ABS06068.1 hypothetical protein Krad_4609 [Kineococcus radiotolerans SRS30216 = ATCC BAA-149]